MAETPKSAAEVQLRRLDERTFLLRHLDIRTTLVQQSLRRGACAVVAEVSTPMS